MKRSTAFFFAILPLFCLILHGSFFIGQNWRTERRNRDEAEAARLAQWGEPGKSAFGDTVPFYAAYSFVADALHRSIAKPGGDSTLLSPTFKAASITARSGKADNRIWLLKGTIAVLPKAGINGRSLDPKVYRWETKQGWDAQGKAWYVVGVSLTPLKPVENDTHLPHPQGTSGARRR